ncbi:MAG: TonB-dependent receptor [Prevotella sp.]|nr:TonB-dependent receptor [Prevotella sp.]MBQ8991640.1 TonB-dependent receptor [Prevotella sp.]
MKRFVLGMAALVSAVSMEASDLDTLRAVELQGVQVVSTRASKKTPVAYTNMSQQELKSVNFGQDIPYLLSLTPSITMTSDAGNGIGYTSLRVRGTDPSRINITANGIPMNDAESAQLYWVNMGDFASSVQSMQIQRGVGTSTNGAGAFGATVNMQTENIGMEPYFGLDLSGGSYYSHKETLRFGTGLIKGHWGIQGRLSNIGSKGYLDRASTNLNSYFIQGGYFSDNMVVKLLTWNGVEETYHAWNYTSKYEQSLYGRTYNSCGEYYDDNGNVHYYDGQTDNYHQQNYQLLWNQRLASTLNLNVTGHYTKGQGYYEEYKTGRKLVEYLPYGAWFDENPKLKSDLIRQKKMDNDFFAFVASLVYNNRENVEAILGGGWNKYSGDHFGLVKWVKNVPEGMELLPDFEYYRNNAKKTDWNVYGKINYDFLPGLNGFLDLQYRHIGLKMQDPGDWMGANPDGKIVIDEKFNFFNPKFGLNYDITRHHKVYASYAIAHKEPTRNDYEDNLGTELKAERLNDLEVGYKFQSAKFSAGANIYWMSYKDQFVLTGELNNIGEAIAKNVGESYRLGVELEAAWKPVDWFRWDANATLSKNRAKEWEVTLMDGSVESLGDTPLSFSPDFIFNNIFTFNYKGMKASVQSQYVGEQYLTNTGFKSYQTLDDNGKPIDVSMMLDGHFTTNVDLSYSFALKQLGLKDLTLGVTLYNIFSAKFDNNGWAAPAFTKENGKVVATGWDTSDQYEAGFAPSAPFNVMAHLSINF